MVERVGFNLIPFRQVPVFPTLRAEASEIWLRGTSRNSGEIAIGKIAMVDHLTAKEDELQGKAEKCKP